jgi:hypothetical protein
MAKHTASEPAGEATLVTHQLAQRLKTSLDELRMQMLGAQVLFGFQFQSLFQAGFDTATAAERLSDGCALATLLASLSVLVCAPAQHRLVEAGEATRRLWSVSQRCAQIALVTMALALACVSFSLAEHVRFQHPLLVAALSLAVSLMGWFGLGLAVRVKPSDREHLREREMADRPRSISSHWNGVSDRSPGSADVCHSRRVFHCGLETLRE